VRVIGHRGAPRIFPENTTASYAAAVELGADAVEVDVCVTRDGALVLWHDNEPGDPVSLARGVGAEEFAFTCDWPHLLHPERRPVYEMTLAEMREHCGYSPSGPTLSGTMPTVPFELVEDLFRWAAAEPRLAEIFFDVKIRPEEAARAPLLLEAVARLRPREDLAVALLLPHREVYEALAPLALPPRTVLVPDFELPNVLEGAREAGARQVSLGYSLRRTWGDFGRELAEVLDARDAGVIERALAWTFNREDRLRWLVAIGADGVLTDDPALLRRIVTETR
jgi:glycerophosphoryl diester phosphodiesterase